MSGKRHRNRKKFKKVKADIDSLIESDGQFVFMYERKPKVLLVSEAPGYLGMKLTGVPLMFPAFPFHPNGAGNPESNRPPIDAELAIGEKYLKELIEIFRIEKFLAVGRKAESTLLKMNIVAPYVRHPANGGANKFRTGLEENQSMLY